MAGMRVHELAKEFGMSSKELLDRLTEMKIPAKSHATVLADAYVAKIRKALEPEVKADIADVEAKDVTKLTKEQKEAVQKKAEEERARRAAVERERAEREAERARRAAGGGTAATVESTEETPDAPAVEEKAAPTPVQQRQNKSALSGLVDQIESEKERVKREAREAEEKARAEVLARDVAKKQAVAEALANQRGGKKIKSDQEAEEETQPTKKVLPAKKSKQFNSLLSQIESEKERIQKKKKEKESTTKESPAKEKKEVAAAPSSKPTRSKKKQSKRSAEQVVPELEATSGEDRYAQMAVQAEKLQRDKVLAEARAAVEAASNEGEGRRKKRKEKRVAEERERLELEALERGLDPELVLDDSVVEVSQGATVSKFAELLGVPPNDIIKRLFLLGQVLTLTQSMNDELIELIADDLGRKIRIVSPEEAYAVVYHDSDAELKSRPPVVTVMGHVDHGKTSLLDAIRSTGVAMSEAGGITQHIGASVVDLDGRQVTFIDTPGHEAFTAMRARGAKVTDVVVLVVAADDGVMPQTVEAVNHAKAAEVPIVVAVNKIDKDGATPERVRQELTEHEIIPEEWGGSNMFVDVSAKKRLHIDDLLESILLQADVLELRANPDAPGSGFVIEANLDKGRGPVATVLVERGTLHPGDVVVAGTAHGRVRALVDPRGKHVDAAHPADPVEILGLDSVPTAGDEFRVFDDEREARKLAEERALRARLAEQEAKSSFSLDDLFARIEEGKTTDLNLVVKADVGGSIEALQDAFDKMDQTEVRINIIHSAVGGITETDVTLAAASDAIIIGFNVRPTGKTRQIAEKEKVDIRLYRVIYQAIEDINAARVGLLSPDIVEKDTGIAEVRETFKVPKAGLVAGCYVIEGEIDRDDKVRVVRDGTVVFEGEIESLRRFKENVKTVKNGYECGIGIHNFQDIKIGDTIEGYRSVEVERTE